MRAEIVPFPLAKRRPWINDKLEKASRHHRRDLAQKYLGQRIDAHAEMLRRFGVSEALIEREIAPVRQLFANWMASSVWPGELGYNNDLFA